MAANLNLPPDAEEVVEAMRSAHHPLTTAEIAALLGRTSEEVAPAVRLLRRREVIRRVSNGRDAPRYGLLRRVNLFIRIPRLGNPP